MTTPSSPSHANGTVYDTVILGSGIAGSMLGAILARHGARVVMLDAAQHPRFAIGESTIPYTLVNLRMLSRRYDVPEIAHLASFPDVVKHITTSVGVKKHFGFLLQHDGQEQNPREVNQFNTPGILHQSTHYFRQDIDAWMFHVAIRYGCEARQNIRVEDVRFDEDGVTVVTVTGEELRARYVVDASGFRSVVANKLGLRDDPCRFKHHARSIFTHMVDVRPTDEVLHHAPQDQPPVPWHEGTMHHLFKRGWFWVIPFNNNKVSRNPLCSVGVTLDERTYPKPTNMTPEEEFYAIASRFPAVRRQFEGARAVRPWVSTDRLQYSSRQVVGERYCLLSHAAGFLDPLFSRGLSNSCEVINILAWRLLEAFKDDQFTEERFGYVNEMQQRLLDYNDDLVNCAYISFDDYDLWNAVFRIWAYGSVPGTVRIHHAIQQASRTGDDHPYRELEEAPNLGLWWPNHKGYADLFALMVETCESYERGEIGSQAAANRLLRELETADWVAKGVGFGDRNARFLNPTPPKLIKMVKWIATEAPPDIKEMALTTVRDAVTSVARGKRVF